MAETGETTTVLIKKRGERRRRRKIFLTVVIGIFIIAAIAAGIFLIAHFKTYDGYRIQSSFQMNSVSEKISCYPYSNGYLECAEDGITFFDGNGVIWEESYEMNQPVIDICGNYAAVADMKQSDVYIYDKSGQLGRISTKHEIIDVEISNNGVVVLAAVDGESNYIELKDIQGNELVNVKSVFSSSGYLSDITVSEDGSKLAAVYIYVSQGSLESKVLFYNFSSDRSGEDVLVGGFNQYSGTVLTTIEFMNGNVVCAIGDDAISFYKFDGTPQIISESLELDWEIQFLKVTENNIIAVTRDNSDAHNFIANVFDTKGQLKAELGFDFSFSRADIYGNNLLLYSSSACHIISFSGLERFSHTFSDSIKYMLPRSSSDYILAIPGEVQFIKLR